MHFSVYDVLYLQNSHWHVSADIPAILKWYSYTRIQKYKCG